MFRKLAVVAAAVAAMGLTTLPASAATASHPRPHSFSIPGTFGLSAWGSYLKSGHSVKVTVCVKDRSRSITAAGAAGLAFNRSGKHKDVVAVALFFGQTSCRSVTTTYTAHLYVDSVSLVAHGFHVSKVKRIY